MFSQRSLVERKRKLLSFSGPVVASVSLFNDKNGSVDNTIEDLLQYVSYLTSIGVTGFYVHGTTGEGLSLNHEEKKKLTENWCSVVKKVAPQALLIINISSCCVSDTLDHVSMCQKLDEVDAVACLPPIYHRPKDVEDLVKYMKLVSSAAPELPLLYYNFPEMTNVSLSMVEFVGTALKEMPNFAGLKFTSKNMAELADLRRSYGTQVKLFAGYEETLLSAAANGVTSAVCAQFNFRESVDAFYQIQKEVESGGPRFLERAQDSQKILADQAQELAKGSFIVNVKRLLQSRVSFTVGKARPPVAL